MKGKKAQVPQKIFFSACVAWKHFFSPPVVILNHICRICMQFYTNRLVHNLTIFSALKRILGNTGMCMILSRANYNIYFLSLAAGVCITETIKGIFYILL